MRLLKLTTCYPDYLKQFYASNIGLEAESYRVQKDRLDYNAYGWSDSWTHAMEPLGCSVIDIISNAKFLQQAWYREYVVDNGKPPTAFDIVRRQVIYHQPDILFVEDYSAFSFKQLCDIKEACPSIVFVIGWCSAPYKNKEVFQAFDLVLSCIPEMVTHFRNNGHVAEHLNHAFDERVLQRIDLHREKSIDFSFVGQIMANNIKHAERMTILKEIVQSIPVEIYSPAYGRQMLDRVVVSAQQVLYVIMRLLRMAGLKEAQLARIPVIRKMLMQKQMPRLQDISTLKPYLRPAVYGLKMYQVIHDSKLVFNNHIDVSPKSASNMRLYEATGVGACLITDWKSNIGELFEPDVEVVTYRSAQECLEKVTWLLDHPAEIEKIALAGQKRTLREHTFHNRAEQLTGLLKVYIG